MLDIYISTIAFNNLSIEEIINISKENNFKIEFSSGLPYREDMELIYNEAGIERMPHNYFPAHKIPFVINLASSNDLIRKSSITHCLNGLKLAKVSNSLFFSAHAGFCIDPRPIELGNKIIVNNDFNKDIHKEFFINSIREIVSFAKKLNLEFLIENNVITDFNLVNSKNPFLCCESSEINWIFNEVKDPNFGLLLDTGHFKVSCKTLNLNIDKEFLKIQKFIKGIHHSDNNSLIDNNQELDLDYWFLKKIKNFKNIPHILEVKSIDTNKIHQQIKILQSQC